MIARLAIVLAAFLAASPALAQSMNPETAKRFVVGKLFAFSCVDGSRGMGRIYGDGSVIGIIQVNGSGPVKSVWLPAGTLRVKGDAICASLKGMSFEPCFNISRTGAESFRGAVAACGLAGGMDMPASVAPFILRSVSLIGIDSVMRPKQDRERAWQRLANDLDRGKLADMTRELGLGDVIDAAREIIAGRVRGRIVVKIS